MIDQPPVFDPDKEMVIWALPPPPSTRPTRSYKADGLGKLDDISSASVSKHLKGAIPVGVGLPGYRR